METFGYILGALSLLIGFVHVIVGIIRNADILLIDARSAIKDELERAFECFLDMAVSNDRHNRGEVEDCAKKCACLQYRFAHDVFKIEIAKWIFNFGVKLMIMIIIIVGVSIGIGRFVFDKDQESARLVFMVLLPFILFICQTFFLGLVIKVESYLKRVVDRYKRAEYYA